MDQNEYTLVEHLHDLRYRLVRAVIGVLVCAVAAFLVAPDLLLLIREPLFSAMERAKTSLAESGHTFDPASVRFVILAPAEYFLSKLKVAGVVGLFIASPWVMYQLWRFIAPGLYKHEQRWAAGFVYSGAFFFCAGGVFAYLAVFPGIFEFFIKDAVVDRVQLTLSIAEYLSLSLKLLIAFGLSFQAPVIVFVLCVGGIVEPKQLTAARPYIVVAGFIVGALLTPPDIVSQVLLALPMVILFELGLIAARVALKVNGTALSRDKREEARAAVEAGTEEAPQDVGEGALAIGCSVVFALIGIGLAIWQAWPLVARLME